MARVTIIDEKHLTRPTISKKAMTRIIEYKDEQIRTRADHIVHLEVNERKMEAQLEDDVKVIKNLKTLLKRNKDMTYLIVCVTYLVGALSGYLIHG